MISSFLDVLGHVGSAWLRGRGCAPSCRQRSCHRSLLEVMGRAGRGHNVELPGLLLPWPCCAQNSQTRSKHTVPCPSPALCSTAPSFLFLLFLLLSCLQPHILSCSFLWQWYLLLPQLCRAGDGGDGQHMGRGWAPMVPGHCADIHRRVAGSADPVFNTEAGDGDRAGERLQTVGWSGVG